MLNKKLLLTLLIGLLIISNLVFGALYWLERGSTTNKMANSNADSSIENSDQTNFTVESSVNSLALDENRQTTTYKSTVGKFALEINSEYIIAEESQVGGETPQDSVRIKVGRVTSSKDGIIALAANDHILIEAFNSKVNGTRDQFVTADTALQAGFSKESRSKIDGIDVRRFDLDGVGSTIKYYFERSGVTYLIEAWDVSSGDTEVMLKDVIEGFSFI